jgi:hypothetical protein
MSFAHGLLLARELRTTGRTVVHASHVVRLGGDAANIRVMLSLRDGFKVVAFGMSALVATTAPVSTASAAGCEKDTDCKGDRVCQSGQCVDAAPSSDGMTPHTPRASEPPRRSYYDQKIQIAQDPRLIKDWQDGDPIPEGYIKTTRLRTGLIGGGAGLFGGLYLVSVLSGAILYDYNRRTGQSQDHWPLFVPVIGPFIDIGTGRSMTAYGAVTLVIDGLGQAGGVAMIIAGVAAPKTVLVRVAGVEVMPMPIVAKDVRGFGFAGTF